MLSMLISGIYIVACLLLLLVVLLQQGKGGDIAAAFGGSGSQAAFGARTGATVLTRATAVLGAMFMVGALVLAIIGQQGPGSVVTGVGNPAPAATVDPATETPVPVDDIAPAPETIAPETDEAAAPTPQ